MPKYGGSYGSGEVAGKVATRLKRPAAVRRSYNNTQLRPRQEPANGKFAHLKPLPTP
jgi:hypothetical protein